MSAESDHKASFVPQTNLERMIDLASLLIEKSGPGVMVASADILLEGNFVDADYQPLNGDIILYSVKSTPTITSGPIKADGMI